MLRPYQPRFIRFCLRPGSVALLELLAAAAGTRIVASHTGVRVGREARLRLGQWRRIAARYETVGGRFRRRHRPLLFRLPADRPGHRLAWAPARGANLDLQLEPPFRERRLQIVHEADEHLVGFLLVLDERVLLPPGAVVDAFAQLVEIVQMVLPLLVDHAEGDVRQRLLAEVARADLGLDVAQIAKLLLEGVAGSFLRRPKQLLARLDHGRIGDARDGSQELLQKLRVDQRAVPLPGIVVVRQERLDEVLDRGVDHPLRLADGGRDPRMGNDLTLFGAGAVHDARDAVGPEEPHEVVFERHVEDALPRIALAPRAAAQLAVDAARLVALRADDDEAARRILVALELFDLGGRQVGLLHELAERRLARLDSAHLTLLDARAEFDVGAAARHVGRDRDRAWLSRLGDNFGFALMVFGVQNLVLEPAPLEQPGQCL